MQGLGANTLRLPDALQVARGNVAAQLGLCAVAAGLAVLSELIGIRVPAIIAGLIVLVALIGASWQQLFLASFVCMVFQGVIAISLPGQVWPLIFGDLLTAALYAKFAVWALAARPRFPFHGFFVLTFGLLVIWAAVQSANPALPNPLMAALGIRTLLFYIPLAWVAYCYFSDSSRLRTFIFTVLLLGALTSIIGIVEYVKGIDWYSNLGPGFSTAAVQVGGFSGDQVYRVNATFSAAGHFGAFLAPTLLLCFGWGILANDSRWGVGSWLAFAILMIGLFVNSQRATTLIVVLGGSGVLLFGDSRIRPGRILTALFGSIAVIGAASILAGRTFLDRVLSFAVDPGGVVIQGHLIEPSVRRLREAISMTTWGMGTGSATAAARYLGSIWEESESFLAAVWYELGLPGLILTSVLLVGVVLAVWQARARARSSDCRILITSVLAYQLGIIAMMGTYAWLHYPPTLLFFWTLTGLAVRLGRSPNVLGRRTSTGRAVPGTAS